MPNCEELQKAVLTLGCFIANSVNGGLVHDSTRAAEEALKLIAGHLDVWCEEKPHVFDKIPHRRDGSRI